MTAQSRRQFLGALASVAAAPAAASLIPAAAIEAAPAYGTAPRLAAILAAQREINYRRSMLLKIVNENLHTRIIRAAE